MQGGFVAEGTQPDNHAGGFVGKVRVVAEGLAGVNVGNVHFYKGQRYAAEGVADGDAGVGVGTGVDDDAAGIAAGGVDALDDGAFAVALEVLQGDAQRLCLRLQPGDGVIQCLSAQNLRFAQAEQVEVGAVEQ